MVAEDWLTVTDKPSDLESLQKTGEGEQRRAVTDFDHVVVPEAF